MLRIHMQNKGGPTLSRAAGRPRWLKYGRAGLATLLAALCVTVNAAWNPNEVHVDKDYDGLDDNFEQALIEANAPWIHINTKEDRMPCDFDWFIRQSVLRVKNVGIIENQRDLETIGRALVTFGIKPDGVYNPPAIEWWWDADHTSVGRSTDFAVWRADCRSPHGSHIDFDLQGEDVYAGQYSRAFFQQAIRKNVGLYAHVAPLRYRPADAGVDREVIIIQYWQLFAFNDAPFTQYDHEGDWNCYETWLDAADPNLTPMVHVWYHHSARTVDYVPGWKPDTNLREGSPYNERTSLDRNGHCYVRGLGHEFYSGHDDGLTHFSYDIEYKGESIPNIGEIAFPMPGYEVLCRFNGWWGDSDETPQGLMRNSGIPWAWPNFRCIHVDATPWKFMRELFKDKDDPVEFYDDYPLGSYGWPFIAISGGNFVRALFGQVPKIFNVPLPLPNGEGALPSLNQAPPISDKINGIPYLVLETGSYPEPVTINVPCKIVANRGPVTLGRP